MFLRLYNERLSIPSASLISVASGIFASCCQSQYNVSSQLPSVISLKVTQARMTQLNGYCLTISMRRYLCETTCMNSIIPLSIVGHLFNGSIVYRIIDHPMLKRIIGVSHSISNVNGVAMPVPSYRTSR